MWERRDENYGGDIKINTIEIKYPDGSSIEILYSNYCAVPCSIKINGELAPNEVATKLTEIFSVFDNFGVGPNTGV